MINLYLPFPPTANNLYPSRGGRRFLSVRAQAYMHALKCAVLDQIGPQPAMVGRIGYRLTIHPPNKHRRDLSNLPKALEDGLTKCGVWSDDSQVDDMQVVRGKIIKGGGAVIEIWEIV